MPKPAFTRRDCARIRRLALKRNNAVLAKMFDVTEPTIWSVLSGSYKPLEDYRLAQHKTCVRCRKSFHPSEGKYINGWSNLQPPPEGTQGLGWYCARCKEQALTVTIRETGRDGKRWVTVHRTADPQKALNRALAKNFGHAHFHISPELTGRDNPQPTTEYTLYGQVVRAGGKVAAAVSIG